MGLSASSCASSINSAMNSYLGSYPSGDFASAFVTAYVNYSKAGVLSSGGGIQGTENAGILTAFFNSFSSSTTDTDFATALANYWSTCLKTPVAPATVLVNDASSKIGAFTTAITNSYRTTDTQPYYELLIQNIENVVKTIQWTVTLSVPPFTRIETVS